MQFNGCFPYKMSEKSGEPVFSLYLFLWAVYMQLLMATVYIQAFEINFSVYFNYDVGTATYVGTVIILMSALCLAPVLLGVRSRLLAELLQEMSVTAWVGRRSAQKWCSFPTMVMLFFMTGISGFVLWFCSTKMGFTNILGIIISAPACINTAVDFMLPEEVSSIVFGQLADRLVAATEATVSKVSTLLAPDGSCKCEGDVQAAVLAMRDLDVVIREVGSNTTASCME